MRRVAPAVLTFACLCAGPSFFGRPASGSGKYARMDRGPFQSWTIDTGYPRRGSFIPKGIVIRLGARGQAAMCFDTQLLKMAAGWTGGFLKFPPGRDGIEGPFHPAGAVRFGARPETVGWDFDGDFDDPRPVPYGPLPAGRAKYRGLYRHGNEVVLSYTVGDCAILEMPAYEGATEVFSRTFNLSSSARPLWMRVCERPGAQGRADGPVAALVAGAEATAVGWVGAPAGAKWVPADGRLDLSLPALGQGARFKLLIWSGPADRLPRFAAQVRAAKPAVDLAPRLRGGPSLWKQTITLKGQRGQDRAAYVVDTIPVPHANPWQSYMRLTGFDFFSDARWAAVATFDGDVWIVSGLDASLSQVRWKRFATGLFQPLGVRIVDDTLYVLGRDQITRLHDLDGDGEADHYENFNNDAMIGTNFHEFSMNLETDGEGNFYFGKSTNWPTRPKTPHEGTVLKVSKDGARMEVFATGVRNPNGLSIGPRGQIAVTDNEGNWTPTCWVGFVRPGAFLGMVSTAHRKIDPNVYDRPICWIPRDMDNSAADTVWVTGERWGPLSGHLLLTGYGTGSLFHVLTEAAGDETQGGIVRFPLQLHSGIIRARFSPDDGQLYVCGMKGWSSRVLREGAFQRVRYTGRPARTLSALHVTRTGVALTFTDPLDPASAADADNYAASRWTYRRSASYGSKEYSLINSRKQGRDTVAITKAALSADGRTVSLTIPDIKPVMGMQIRVRLRAADGSAVSLALHHTIHRVPD